MSRRTADDTRQGSVNLDPPISHRSILVRGVVQGVGFRPFVYRLATEANLAGSIGNNTAGVTIELEGPPAQLDVFLRRLRAEAPPLSRIDAVAVEDLPVTGLSGFRIQSSQVLGRVNTGIPADAATCDDCLRELLDPADRRYRYPFLNCTNCGPRFTITRHIPYDRPQTSMAVFPMCAACQAEYDDPLNRRFHAQPNACPQCGPHVWLEDSAGLALPSSDPVTDAISRLVAGEILAIKGIGGFHLSVDATSEAAVALLRKRKRRYGKPLAVMVRDLASARVLCHLTAAEEALLQTPARPILLARARLRPGSGPIAPSVAPGIPWLGIFLPYAPLQHLLFADARIRALVMTSANLSEEPIAIDNAEARIRLGAIADTFLMHNREILQRCDDSVAALVDGAPQLIRRARGYVPLGIDLPFDAPPLLAVGGHLKSVFTLAAGRSAYQSQHLGDLESIATLDFFRESLDHLMRTFEIEPELVVHDLHPGYLSTSWAKEWAAAKHLPLIAAQHHHAHIAACMAERALSGPVIGLSLDGTGYGADGRIWGGEVVIAHYDRFDRFAHLEYIPLPGGEAAIHEPWRTAFGALHANGLDAHDSALLQRLGATQKQAALLARMIERSLNAPLTSSCGRLFDAAAAIVLRQRKVDYEAQAAILLEGVAADEPDEPDDPDDISGYPIELRAANPGDPAILATGELWRRLLADVDAAVPAARIAARFHAGVSRGFIDAAVRAAASTGVRQVALSGGCLHNRRLARLLRSGLEARGFEVFQHRRTSPGDGGLSYGQAAVAAAIMRKNEQEIGRMK